MARITINNITFDPSAAAPHALEATRAPLPQAALTPATASQSDYVLVQTHGPLTRAQKDQLRDVGAEILEYVPEETYLCHFPPQSLDGVRALPFVRWAGPYLNAFKVAPTLISDSPNMTVQSLERAADGIERVDPDEPRRVDVILHAKANPDAALAELAAATGDPSQLKPGRGKVRLTATKAQLAEIAKIDAVHHIEEVLPVKLHNDVARGLLGAPAANGTGALTGAGQIVAVADTGFDRGSRTNAHPAFTGRVARLYAKGRLGVSDDPNGHGTHVAGSVLGDGHSPTLGVRVQGTAPGASLVFQSLLDNGGGLGGIPNDLGDLFDEPYQNDGARIHTNSWGSIVGDSRYDQQCRELDDFVRQHRDCLVIFSAGNEGKDMDQDGVVDEESITPPGVAKNCLTVGASENRRPNRTETYGSWWPGDFPAAPVAVDVMADNDGGMVAFSSRGPTLDGRFKPDVVAPGTFVLSTRSRRTTGTGWGLSGDPLYYYMGGTSMATPLVAGCAALLREWLVAQHGHTAPSGALMKALIINGAEDLPGQYTPSEAPAIPNSSEGFGRVNLAGTVGTQTAPGQLQFWDEATELDTDEEETRQLTIAAGVTRLKVTLVWTDLPGSGLKNDLDLSVETVDGTSFWHGNMPLGAPGFDRANNVEQVVWANPPAGQFTIRVRAFRATVEPQSYALVARVW
jgi:serine protease AprX